MLPLPDLCPEGAALPVGWGRFARDLRDRYPGTIPVLHVAAGECFVTLYARGPLSVQGAARFALPPEVRRVHVRAVPLDA